jgi:hypothetical protein
MTDIERLLAIEDIKRVKSKYFYCLDHQDWAGWKREVFAPDASMDIPEAQKEPVVGIDRIIEWVSFNVGVQVSVHHGHMPDIEILSADSATGIWAMEDILHRPKNQPHTSGIPFTYLHGFGHYHESYVRGPVGWRIKTTRLSRLHLERTIAG